MSQDHTAVEDNPRRRELVERIDRGDYDLAFEASMEPEALRQGFEMCAYTARAEYDPDVNFDAFLHSLWRQVANMFDIQAPASPDL